MNLGYIFDDLKWTGKNHFNEKLQPVKRRLYMQSILLKKMWKKTPNGFLIIFSLFFTYISFSPCGSLKCCPA